MYAVIESGGKQQTVEKGRRIKVEKLDAKPGETVELPVLLISGDGETMIGAPQVDGASVKAKVIKQDKARKVVVFKYKRKIGYRRKQGHRQPYTLLEITDIVTPGGSNSTAEAAENSTAEAAE